MKSVANNIRIAPQKTNLIAKMVRGKTVVEALNILKFTAKRASHPLYKVIASAAANAQNNLKQKLEDLIIKEIVVTKGSTLKRSIPISRGRTHPIKKRTSHIRILLETKPNK